MSIYLCSFIYFYISFISHTGGDPSHIALLTDTQMFVGCVCVWWCVSCWGYLDCFSQGKAPPKFIRILE